MTSAKESVLLRTHIDVTWLESQEACREHVLRFRAAFGESAEITPGLIRRAKAASLDLGWAADRLLTAAARKAYQEAEAAAWDAYQEAKAPAWDAYQEADAAARKAYQEADAAALIKIIFGGDS